MGKAGFAAFASSRTVKPSLFGKSCCFPAPILPLRENRLGRWDLAAFTGNNKAADLIRPRPALFRALGKDEPPGEIIVDGQTYRRVTLFKHDSWAATALYQSTEQTIVCKFNRRQDIGF